MQLTEHRGSGALLVTRVEAAAVVVGDRRLAGSFLLSARELLVLDCGAEPLTVDTLEPALTLQPEVVLVGLPASRARPMPRLQAEVAGRGVGLEVMSKEACARTYNVLVTEGRRVVALFLC